MGNCPLKSKDEPFAIAMTPLSSGYLKKAWNGMQKTLCKVYCQQHVETWCKSIFTQSFKSSLIAVYERFSLQSFDSSIKVEMFFMIVYFKCGYWKIRKENKNVFSMLVGILNNWKWQTISRTLKQTYSLVLQVVKKVTLF